MIAWETSSTVVVGLGNPVVSDDRVGLAVAAELRRLLEESPIAGVEVRESYRGGFELIDLLRGFRRAILIDCLTIPNPVPGRVAQLTLSHASSSPRLCNPHEIGIAEAFALASQLGIRMPETIEIYAVEGADVLTVSEQMSCEVARVVAPLARRIFEELSGQLGRRLTGDKAFDHLR